VKNAALQEMEDSETRLLQKPGFFRNPAFFSHRRSRVSCGEVTDRSARRGVEDVETRLFQESGFFQPPQKPGFLR
jgi:hypothetical protein